MAARRPSKSVKVSDPSVELLEGTAVDLREFEQSAEIDLRGDSVLRARLAHESPGEWIAPYPAMSAEVAREVAKKWRTAKPTTFGGSQRFEAEVVRLIPRQWWRAKELVEQWTVKVRYPVAVPSPERTSE